MSVELAARCGIYCGDCEYREKFNCPGCMKADGKMFWGNCQVAACSIAKELKHCGECGEFACEKLKEFAYDPEQGDNGQRIRSLEERNAEGTESWIQRRQ